jgi:hypothetical protein
MASKSNLISAFRNAVTIMQEEYNKALILAHFAEDLSWDETALATEFSSSSDISAADFVAAMDVIKAIETSNSGIALTLLKLRP